MVNLQGDNNNNTLIGTNFGDNIKGLGGNDTVFGESGKDVINGGSGRDFLNGGKGNDTIFGGKGSDSIQGGQGNDSLSGGQGNDDLFGGAGNDTIVGGHATESTRDNLTGGAGNDLLDVRNYGKTNNDYATVTDFNASSDKIQVQGHVTITQQGTNVVIKKNDNNGFKTAIIEDTTINELQPKITGASSITVDSGIVSPPKTTEPEQPDSPTQSPVSGGPVGTPANPNPAQDIYCEQATSGDNSISLTDNDDICHGLGGNDKLRGGGNRRFVSPSAAL